LKKNVAKGPACHYVPVVCSTAFACEQPRVMKILEWFREREDDARLNSKGIASGLEGEEGACAGAFKQ